MCAESYKLVLTHLDREIFRCAAPQPHCLSCGSYQYYRCAAPFLADYGKKNLPKSVPGQNISEPKLQGSDNIGRNYPGKNRYRCSAPEYSTPGETDRMIFQKLSNVCTKPIAVKYNKIPAYLPLRPKGSFHFPQAISCFGSLSKFFTVSSNASGATTLGLPNKPCLLIGVTVY
jgi:hypothetical protein